MKYELTKDLETGNAVIDSEHRELLAAVNRLTDACGKGDGITSITPAVRFLLDYVDRHFAHEEQLQKSAGYPAYEAHRAFHEDYKRKLKEIAGQIPAVGAKLDDLVRLNGQIAVLIAHIRIEDKKLGKFLQTGK